MAFQRSPLVVYEVVDGQAVLVDPAGVELLTLNEVGTLVWEQLDGRRDAEHLAADLVGIFSGVTAEELARDIAEFLAEVESAGLVVPAGDAAS
jgi:hypothetical protein